MRREHRLIDDFAQAISRLESAMRRPADDDLIRAGCIQYFEFCFELAWKPIKHRAAEEGLECLSPRACLRTAFAQGWIDGEGVWLSMLDARSRMSHTYPAQDALSVYDQLGTYLQHSTQLLNRLKTQEPQSGA